MRLSSRLYHFTIVPASDHLTVAPLICLLLKSLHETSMSDYPVFFILRFPSLNQLINQSINQQINLSFNPSIKKSINRLKVDSVILSIIQSFFSSSTQVISAKRTRSVHILILWRTKCSSPHLTMDTNRVKKRRIFPRKIFRFDDG